ncbi:MAG TPA: ABC transporter permease [Bacillota bacterium]|nr:ABC transporter permease [Bacillota bacterium]
MALVLGVAIALAMALQPRLKAGVEPLLVVSQTVPVVTIYPLLMIWLGYGVIPKIVVVALVCFFPIVISLVDGMESADGQLAEWMKQMGGSRWQILWKLRLPWAMPQLVSGLKVAATYSVMGAVIGEWMGAAQGLGVYINRSANSFLVDRVFAAIGVIVVLSLILYGLIEIAARLGMPWYYSNLKEEQD